MRSTIALAGLSARYPKGDSTGLESVMWQAGGLFAEQWSCRSHDWARSLDKVEAASAESHAHSG
jgi:hypothetical protein